MSVRMSARVSGASGEQNETLRAAHQGGGRMIDLTPLRERLLDLRHRTLVMLAERSKDKITDTGLISKVGSIQITLAAIDEEEGR